MRSPPHMPCSDLTPAGAAGRPLIGYERDSRQMSAPQRPAAPPRRAPCPRTVNRMTELDAERQRRVECHVLASLGDLEQLLARMQPGVTEYDVIRASGVLRRLLVDNVLGRANRSRGLKIRYRTAYYTGAGLPPELEPDIRATFEELWPEQAPPHWERREQPLHGFLAIELVRVGGEPFSVRDIIKLAANALGGVHLGDPHDNRLVPLMRANDAVAIGELPLIAGHLAGIAAVTLAAAEPLRSVLLEYFSARTGDDG